MHTGGSQSFGYNGFSGGQQQQAIPQAPYNNNNGYATHQEPFKPQAQIPNNYQGFDRSGGGGGFMQQNSAAGMMGGGSFPGNNAPSMSGYGAGGYNSGAGGGHGGGQKGGHNGKGGPGFNGNNGGQSYGGGGQAGSYGMNSGMGGMNNGMGGMSNGMGGMNNGVGGMKGASSMNGAMKGGMGGSNFDGDSGGFDEQGSWQEYSRGTGTEYAQESLWTQEEDDEFASVNVFGPGGDAIPPALTTFEAAAQVFPQSVIQKFQAAGFQRPTPIQAHTWAITNMGRDLIGVAKTGSGKTLAFLLPGFLKILPMRATAPLLFVLAPTRELAVQIEQEAEKFGRHLGIRTACCYGGASRGPQIGQIRRGAQVLVACPGRLNDFLQCGIVTCAQCCYLVLDEADRMLDMGFEPQIRKIIQMTDPAVRQTLLFTATWPREVRSLASEFLRTPLHVQTGKSDALTANLDISQHVIFCANEQEKVQNLGQIIQQFLPTDRLLVFCETKRATEQLAGSLVNYQGLSAVRIHGDMEQRDRTMALNQFKSGRSPILVATDVAARGLDVKGVSCVVNFDAAGTAKDYVHRIGRTGRAGAKGVAYSLLLKDEERQAKDIVQVMQRNEIPIPPELQALAATVARKGKGKGKKGKGKGRGFGGKGWNNNNSGGYGGKGGGNFGGGGKGKGGGFNSNGGGFNHAGFAANTGQVGGANVGMGNGNFSGGGGAF